VDCSSDISDQITNDLNCKYCTNKDSQGLAILNCQGGFIEGSVNIPCLIISENNIDKNTSDIDLESCTTCHPIAVGCKAVDNIY
jgi:hypothetical protein